MAEEPLEVECDACGLDPICQVLDYAEAGSGVPEGVLLRRLPVARGETLFQANGVFSSIFAVKSGSFKTYIPSTGKGDRVIGFHQPGELIGVEAVSSGSYPCTARALEPISVCELWISQLPEAGRPRATALKSA
ncbi:MAG: cyclic nucleotide-binding domain-containing protein [gamma proteobacterium endosymbiont of Lamellibrachia anaximandri]|nr:cyclic nucleotide-binding domain-containing protein [gamma proteobacterium endosymbiont of Lamellibrachia anaximandri]